MRIAFLAGLCLLAPRDGGPYDADPKHPWNELHQALFTWRPTMGKIPGGVVADPLHWPLGAAPWTFSEALGPVLDRFEQENALGLVKDPLKRALLQHDLWMFVDGLEGLPLGDSRSMPPETEAACDAARRRLVPLMKRLALTPEEIAALPDTYAAASSSGRHAAAFDAEDPEKPFLPADLWDPKGPWVLVGRDDKTVIAPQHVMHFRGQSVFFIFMALPGGRDATIKYLQRIAAVKGVRNIDPTPAGTRVALVRRALLIDAKGELHLSPLTEEVQIRAALAKGRPAPAGLFEFHLNRGDLLGGAAGGLQAAKPGDEGVRVFFHRLAAKEIIRKSCVECHPSGVIPMVAFRQVKFDEAKQKGTFDGVALLPSTATQETELVVKWKRANKTWALLQPFWPKD